MLADSNSGPKRRVAVTALLLILVVVVASLGVYEYTVVRSIQGQNTNLSSRESGLESSLSSQSNAYTSLESLYQEDGNVSGVIEAFDSHLAHIDELNATAVADDYTPNSTMRWAGADFGLGGAYNGTSSIGYLWQTFLDEPKHNNIATTIYSVNATRLPNETVTLHADMFFDGSNNLVGSYNFTTSGMYWYVFQSGRWLISREMTSFTESSPQEICGGCIP